MFIPEDKLDDNSWTLIRESIISSIDALPPLQENLIRLEQMLHTGSHDMDSIAEQVATYFKIIGWGWYYLSTVLDDYSRKIIAWKLCTSMTADDVKDTLDLAIEVTSVNDAKVVNKTRLLSDNGPCYISSELKDYLKDQNMVHSRGRPFHPQTQGKIERYHRSMKNVIHLDNYYLPSELEYRISLWVDYYNNHRYHESLNNITPSDKYDGLENKILKKRRKIKEKTLRRRRVWNKKLFFGSGKLRLSPV